MNGIRMVVTAAQERGGKLRCRGRQDGVKVGFSGAGPVFGLFTSYTDACFTTIHEALICPLHKM